MGFEKMPNQESHEETREARLQRLREFVGAPDGANSTQILEYADADGGQAPIGQEDMKFLREEIEKEKEESGR